MERREELFQTYVNGWRENNLTKILSVLAPDCIIIESHGPTYSGKEMIEKWITTWLKDGGKVLQWDILCSHYANYVSFFEWEFSCLLMEKNTFYLE